MLYSLAENVNFGEAIWWSITTTTTVGYGDISPQTPLGKFAAIILMFTGIGIIGMLTSAITSYFENEDDEKEYDSINKRLDKIDRDNQKILAEIKSLKHNVNE